MKKQIHFGNKSSKSNLDFKKLNELQERLQGTSENSNPVTDPFKFLGEFDSYDKLNATLDTLTYSLGYQKGYGYFRARVGDRAIEVKSILMSSSLNVVGQVVQGMLSLDGNKKLSSADSTYKIYFRKHQNNVWGEWKEITGTTSGDGSVDLSDYVKGIQLSQGLIIHSKNNIIDLEGVFVEYSTLSEYLKASDAESTYLKKTAKAANAITADSATKAIQDGNGNNIVNTYATEEYVDTEVTTLWENIDQKQDTLVSGTNIKTINNQSILGKGNITITGGGEAIDLSEYLKASDAKSTYATKKELEELDSYVVKTIQINDASYFPDPEKDEGVLKLPFKTINGQSIIKESEADSDNIEITGGDGSVDLTGYVKKTELATINGNSLFEGGNITITGGGGADPFKYIYADDYVDLSNQLDRLTPSEDNIGFFLAKINNKTIEIQHILLATDFTYSLQIVKGAIKIDEENNLRIADDAEYRVLNREYTGVNFTAWEEVGGASSAQVNTNTANITKLMNEIFPPMFTVSCTPDELQASGTTTDFTVSWKAEIDGVEQSLTDVQVQVNDEGWQSLGNKVNSYTVQKVAGDTTVSVKAKANGQDVSGSASISFAYRAYIGVAGEDFDLDNLQTMVDTSSLELSKDKARYITTNGPLWNHHIIYAYQKGYGAITSIKDGNGLDVTEAFERKTKTLGNDAEYFVYISKEPISTSTKVTVKFS